MIILDTNVLSALMQDDPDPAVVAWLDSQSRESIWITSISLFETLFGITLLAKGKRQRHLEAAFGRLLEDDLDNRILDFDRNAAAQAATLAAARRKIGRPVDRRETQIAGITLARRATLATRNVKHFQDLSLKLIDPWAAPAR